MNASKKNGAMPPCSPRCPVYPVHGVVVSYSLMGAAGFGHLVLRVFFAAGSVPAGTSEALPFPFPLPLGTATGRTGAGSSPSSDSSEWTVKTWLTSTPAAIVPAVCAMCRVSEAATEEALADISMGQASVVPP